MIALVAIYVLFNAPMVCVWALQGVLSYLAPTNSWNDALIFRYCKVNTFGGGEFIWGYWGSWPKSPNIFPPPNVFSKIYM